MLAFSAFIYSSVVLPNACIGFEYFAFEMCLCICFRFLDVLACLYFMCAVLVSCFVCFFVVCLVADVLCC